MSSLYCLCYFVWLGLAVWVWPSSAHAQPQRIYRCGNTYTNQPDPSAQCKPMTGGLVTVIEGTRVQHPPVGSASTGAGAGANSAINAGAGANPNPIKVDSAEQRQRDMQAQAVLELELQRVKQQQAELLREWNNGEPERRADEHRQPQKYQDRIAQLRGALQRIEADVAGLQRELVRLSVANPIGNKP